MEGRAQTIERLLGIGLVALLILGCLMVLRPFLVALIWAGILCYTTWPVYLRVLNALGGRRTLAAFCCSCSLVLLLLVPFLLIGLSMAGGVQDLLGSIGGALTDGLPKPPGMIHHIPFIGDRLHDGWMELSGDREKLIALAQRILEPIGKWLIGFGMVVARGVVQIGLSIFITFFLYKYGNELSRWLVGLVREMIGEAGERFIEVAGNTIRAVVFGILGTAVVQGILAGIGFAIAGVPGAGVLALGTFLLSPAGGPPLIWLPVTLWLFKSGSFGWGIFMLIWGIGVSTVDNLVKPWLISRGTQLPFVLVFFGIVGGVLAFGFVGVFIGPTLLAVGYRVAQDWLLSKARPSGD